MTTKQENRLRNLVLMVLWFGFGFYLFGFITQILLTLSVAALGWFLGFINFARDR
jgi:hypothetical protein